MSKLYVDAITNREGVNAVNFPDGITGTAATFTGNVTIGGTLTYEDVTNIDSVGLITARNGLEITSGGINVNSGGANITGVLTATSFSGDGSNLQNISLPSDANINITGTITATSFTGDGSGLVFAPKVIAFNPAALGTGVAVDTNITITFDQNIQFAGTGTVELRYSTYVAPTSEWSSNTGTLIESFAITNGSAASGLNISGTQLIITPTSDLPTGSTIYIVLPSQGIQGTSGSLYYAGSNNYSFRTVATSFSAQGGDYVYTLVNGSSPTGYYKYHIFTGAGILTTTSPSSNADDLSVLLVGGGGAGGRRGSYPDGPIEGGGGGAGGVISRTGPTLNLSTGTYTIEVGAGGVVSSTSPSPTTGFTGGSGGDTKILTPTTEILTAYGGGGGGGSNTGSIFPGKPGGSGGGGHYWPMAAGGTGTPGQGHNGQNASTTYTAPPPGYSPNPAIYSWSGGGGGAGGSGSSGNGGPGTPIPAFPSSIMSGYLPSPAAPPETLSAIGPTGLYGGGGSGGYRAYVTSPVLVGGPGGGGTLPHPSQPTASFPETVSLGRALTGGGGSAGPHPGGFNGGSGVFMIRYSTPGV